MVELKKLPIGIESFEKMRQEDFYYVDKTRLIEQLLLQWGEVNLFTRPRRFGKTLNMSMFQNFFRNRKRFYIVRWTGYFEKCTIVRKVSGEISCCIYKPEKCKWKYI